MEWKHDLPESKGVENGIKRAKQMTEFRWTPVLSLPAVVYHNNMNNERVYMPIRFSPWLPEKGLVYSSVLMNQKFIGFNVSFEGFVTALSDPRSVLYKYNVDGRGRKNANCWYGVVCSCFASYVLGMKERWICARWPSVKNVTMLGQPPLKDLKLLDIVLNTKQHIAIITDILRDENGDTVLIEVSESTLPLCKATYFTPEEFKGFWYDREFNIYRKSDLDGISYTPSAFVRIKADPGRGIEGDPNLPEYTINRDILPDQGNKTNYMEKQEIVIDVLKDGWDRIEVTDQDGNRESFPVENAAVVIPAESAAHRPGFYTAVAVSADGFNTSREIAYAVTGLKIEAVSEGPSFTDPADPGQVKPAAKLEIRFANASADEPDMLYIHKVSTSGEKKRYPLTKEDIAAGRITIELPEEEDDWFLLLTAANEYGEYTSNHLYVSTRQ